MVIGLLAATCACARQVPGSGSHAGAPAVTSAPVASPSSPPTSSSRNPPTSARVSTPPTRSSTTRLAPPTQSAPAALPSWLLGKEWDRIPVERRVVALTFDAGGDASGVASILATLSRERVDATFFLTGSWVSAFPSQARAICAAHRVADHSVTHPHFPALTNAEIRAEVLNAATLIRNTCHTDPAPLFRFPYGDRDSRTIRAVNSLGYVPVSWTVDTLGWQGTLEGISMTTVIARVVAQARPGEIVLMHVGANPYDNSTLDADALPGVIGALRSMGYGFVTLNALLTAA
jgi:peptidoglycan/xylan/chitin deacetylase (PgdA/CDA1 family)